MSGPRARRSHAGGAKKRPTRYGSAVDPHVVAALADALRAHRHGDFARASSVYADVLERSPGCLDAWMNHAAVLVMLGRANDARTAFAHARVSAASNPRALRDIGIGLAALGDWTPSRDALELSLRLDPVSMGARLALVRVCADAGDVVEARALAREAIAREPDNASAHLEYARVLFDCDTLDDSLAAARRALELDSGFVHARYLAAGIHAFRGETEALVALLPESSLPASMCDALEYLASVRRTSLRSFANRRDTLRFAVAASAHEGAVLEFGVRHGISTRVLAESVGRDVAVDAFDSFDGLPESWVGRARGAFATAGEMPSVPDNVRLHRGWFDDTLPGFVAALDRDVRMLHIDSDLYSSARSVLFALAPRIRPGCIIVFDEYLGHASWRDDEFRAFREAREQHDWRYEYRAISWITGQAVVEITHIGAGAHGAGAR